MGLTNRFLPYLGIRATLASSPKERNFFTLFLSGDGNIKLFKHFVFMLTTKLMLTIDPLNAELNPICQLLALLGAHHILHISRIRVKMAYRCSSMHYKPWTWREVRGLWHDPAIYHTDYKTERRNVQIKYAMLWYNLQQKNDAWVSPVVSFPQISPINW